MAQIVEQRRETNETGVFRRKATHLRHQAGDVKNAKRVFKTSMQRTRVHQAGERQLMDTPKPLEYWRCDDIRFFTREPNETVNRISDASRFAHLKTFRLFFVCSV